MSASRERVIPYVEDRRNVLLVEPAGHLDQRQMASLAAALRRGILLTFQLEEQELAAEPLPDERHRRLLLFFYEAAEGGAGVLRRLVDDPDAVGRVARAALETCHFDPNAGEDLRRAPRAKEDCEAACYDCLMSYTNQPDHPHLDRKAIRDLLLGFARAAVRTTPGTDDPARHLDKLERLCQTELERRWLRFAALRRLRLPSRAQAFIESARACPDFVYDDQRAAIFVDGPVHHYPDIQLRDAAAAGRLEDLGWTVIRFTDDEGTWEEVVRRWPSVFGRES
jgi:very-short-patch-repair endonuclease